MLPFLRTSDMSIRSPPPKKRSPLEEYYENYGKRRATDVSKWKVTLTGALPGVNQSVQNLSLIHI